VYRVENSNGLGVYNGIKINCEDHYKNPSPEKDYPISELFGRFKGSHNQNYKKEYNFGFIDKCQFFDWFKESEIEFFKNKGVEFNIYEVPENLVISSKKQCVFKLSSSLKLNKFDFKSKNNRNNNLSI
jgi:hypothetical protein